MPERTPFLQCLHDEFNIDVEPHPAWQVFDGLQCRPGIASDFVEKFLEEYPGVVREHPELREHARPLFAALTLYAVKQTAMLSGRLAWVEHIDPLVYAWTEGASLDMSEHEAQELASHVRPLLKGGGFPALKAAEMLSRSRHLWDAVEASMGISRTLDKERHNHLLYRYLPTQFPLNDPREIQNFYGFACGWLRALKPNIVNIHNVLVPDHHCTQAWSRALTDCDKSPGQWMALAPVLRTLPLAPCDTYSWEMMLTLHEEANRDSSCQELIAFLNTANPDMARAYESIWPCVTALYGEDDRVQAAVNQWKTGTPVETMNLPAFSTEHGI